MQTPPEAHIDAPSSPSRQHNRVPDTLVKMNTAKQKRFCALCETDEDLRVLKNCLHIFCGACIDSIEPSELGDGKRECLICYRLFTLGDIEDHYKFTLKQRHDVDSSNRWKKREETIVIKSTNARLALEKVDRRLTIPWSEYWKEISARLLHYGFSRSPDECETFWFQYKGVIVEYGSKIVDYSKGDQNWLSNTLRHLKDGGTEKGFLNRDKLHNTKRPLRKEDISNSEYNEPVSAKRSRSGRKLVQAAKIPLDPTNYLPLANPAKPKAHKSGTVGLATGNRSSVPSAPGYTSQHTHVNTEEQSMSCPNFAPTIPGSFNLPQTVVDQASNINDGPSMMLGEFDIQQLATKKLQALTSEWQTLKIQRESIRGDIKTMQESLVEVEKKIIKNKKGQTHFSNLVDFYNETQD